MWDDLLKTLNSSEYECIISCLHTERYKKDEIIVSAGEIDPCLYFINSGSVRLSCTCGSREVFLKRLKPGDVLGVAPFFSASVWTVNITALQATNVQVISKDSFLSGSGKFPELEEKLADFCKRKENVRKLVTMSGRDRRDSARYPLSVTFTNVLLDRYGEREGRRTFKSEMIDISRGGMSFSIRISNKASAGRLLGRQVVSEIKLKKKRNFQCLGLVVSVQELHEIAKEYSVHVKFYKELEQQQVTDILNMAFY
jgi:CRP-like cAMP-binding protein